MNVLGKKVKGDQGDIKVTLIYYISFNINKYSILKYLINQNNSTCNQI